MNAKENMIAALKCQQPADYVPIWEIEFQAWDNLSGKHVTLGREFGGLPRNEQDYAIHQNAEIIVETCIDLHFSALTVINSYWEVAPGHPSYYWLPEEWKKKQNALLQSLCEKNGIATVAGCSGMISMPGDINIHGDNYMEFCYRIHDDPESIDEWAKKTCADGIESARMCRDAGFDIVVSPSDIADNKGPFYSPEQMDRWFYPYLRKWTEEVERMGLYSILHTDGNVTSLLDDLAESRLYGLQAIDPLSGMDIAKAKVRVAGRLCLCGNMETGLLITGTEDQIYESAGMLLRCCKDGGGFVFGTSNAAMCETPARNYRQTTEAWKKYGQYGA